MLFARHCTLPAQHFWWARGPSRDAYSLPRHFRLKADGRTVNAFSFGTCQAVASSMSNFTSPSTDYPSATRCLGQRHPSRFPWVQSGMPKRVRLVPRQRQGSRCAFVLSLLVGYRCKRRKLHLTVNAVQVVSQKCGQRAALCLQRSSLAKRCIVSGWFDRLTSVTFCTARKEEVQI